MAGGYMQEALLLQELTALLGSGRFKTLLKHLRAHLPSLRVAAHQHLVSPTAEAHKAVEDGESLQCDELVAEIEQRVTQLESVLSRYNSRFDPFLLQPQKPKQVSDTLQLCNPDTLHTLNILRSCIT
jgi:hypothetical protein